jgi:OFA family oxalate/formate antiporter-like MFS transporter
MLYTAKGTASLLVPLASVAAANYGWQAVFVIAVGLNATAALLALFVIKPMRRAFILGDEAAPVDVIARTVGTLPFESKRGELRVSLSFLSPKHWYTKYKRTA